MRGVALISVVLWGACTDASGPRAADGVSVLSRRARGSSASAIGATAGDLLVDDGRLQAVVGRAARRPGYGDVRGVLLDLGVPSLSTDRLRRLEPSLVIDGSRRRIHIESVEPLPRSRVPAIEVRGFARFRGVRLAITVLYLLRGELDALEIVTRVENPSARTLALRVAHELSWEDGPAFAPGIGRVNQTQIARGLRWFARAGQNVTYALASTSGLGEVRFDVRPALGAPDLEGAVATSDEMLLPAHGRARLVRYLVAAAGDVSSAAAAVARLARQPLERVRGRTKGLGEGALLLVLDATERPVLEAILPAEGSFAIDLPTGRFFLETATFGRTPPPRRTIDVALGRTSFVSLPAPDEPGSIAVTVRETATGASLPARIVVRGRWSTVDPVFGPPGQAAGAGYGAHTRSGAASLSLPAGRYRVAVSHGPEWTLFVQDVMVRPGDRTAVDATLERAVLTPGMIACDLHLHAAPSPDSQTSLEDRLVSLVAEGLEFVVATDHNRITDYRPVMELLGLGGKIVAITGEEVTTESPHIGHFNVFPLDPTGTDRILPFAGITPAELFEAVRAVDPAPLLQVNHPWGDHSTGYFVLFGLDAASGRADVPLLDLSFDTIEVYNGMWLGDATILAESFQGFVDLLALGRRYVGTGNSDSHHLVNQWAGYPRTYVLVDDDDPASADPAAVVSALRAGRAFVTSGPIVRLSVGGGRLGDTVVAQEGGVEVLVEIEAAPWVDVRRIGVWSGAELAHTAEVPARPEGSVLRMQHRAFVPTATDTFILASVEGDVASRDVLPQFAVGPRAFTNPVYVDADGDGRVAFAAPPQPAESDAAAAPAHTASSVGPDDAGSTSQDASVGSR